jgi:hypothetical protein
VVSELALLFVALVAIAGVFRWRTTRSARPQRPGSATRRSVVVASEIDVALARCREALAWVAKPRVPAHGDPARVLEAVSGPGWRSMGSVLRAELEPVRGGTRVVITGWPGSALYDWGVSERLVESVADAMNGGQAPDAG